VRSSHFQLPFNKLKTIFLLSGSSSDGYPPEGKYYPDNSKSKAILGIQYKGFEDTLKDQLEQFLVLEKELGAQ
jgi:hypothetical protein